VSQMPNYELHEFDGAEEQLIGPSLPACSACPFTLASSFEEIRMPRPASASALDLRQGMQEAFAVNDRINQLVLQHLDPRAWRAQLPGSKGRTIAAIFSHVHNIRCKWLRLSAPYLNLPPRLDRTRCTQKQASHALAQSAALCSQLLADALTCGRVKKFQRDGWARPWTPGAAMFAYMLTHEAHHRGQVCMLAHQLGFPLPNTTAYGMWVWEKLWKQCGFGPPQ
jgi:uncharacterized damage-inducible protein DinB